MIVLDVLRDLYSEERMVLVFESNLNIKGSFFIQKRLGPFVFLLFRRLYREEIWVYIRFVLLKVKLQIVNDILRDFFFRLGFR